MSALPLPMITLLTDFGSRDTYVGQMKGAMLSIAPGVSLVDLTHDVTAGDVLAGALAWMDAVTAFPAGTIHLGVIDPGVGSDRRAIAAEIGPWKFVFPDNGLATALRNFHPLHRAVEIHEQRFWRPNVSPVFHGRDVFGPVAAHWASGVELGEFGPAILSPLVEIELPRPKLKDGAIHGCVLTADRFGNLRTNIPAAILTFPALSIEINDATIDGLTRCFSEAPAGRLCAVIGSHGHLEIAVNRGNAQESLNATRGAPVTVRSASNPGSGFEGF